MAASIQKTMSAREFNQNLSRAKRDALAGPVVITDRGAPSHVLLSYEEYSRLTDNDESFVEKLFMKEPVDVEVEPLNFGLQQVDF
ncbi:type II toxin-antitoxin system Phd/YefM family antitoxin [Corynebacterium sp. HMSC29G08]|uniref:type II toxin-antitoxin system Phd/YefM family antitoxin n=1 Tax=Corynebacterium sp. HMSC29G08 TaxID=1581069 RepID=UPI0008A30E23|nr:type II toxin-antitoxin system Phd/YefM family antitoxin [Corynebacterium sp. HMSC29G08]OFT86276.1 hypothetical protein HMPREF3101_00720 [Corynebacterium sp. HMSC29G08]